MDETPNQAETNNTPPAAEPQPAKPVPDIVAQAEAETPIKTAPIFPTDQPAKKSKAPLIAILASLFIIGAGVATWFITHPNNPSNTSVQNDISEVTELKPVEYSNITLRNNELSDFDLTFLRLENKQDNIVYSPLSIKYALAMLNEGAKGNSKTQIESLIGDYTPKSYLNSENRSLANVLFVRDRFQTYLVPEYSTTLNQKYNASAVVDPFASAAPMNKWVNDKTLGIIDNLLKDEQVNDSDFILINALAIDMVWKNRIQCTYLNNDLPCLKYSVSYPNIKYYAGVGEYISEAYQHDFGDQSLEYESVRFGATSNHYDILKELGEANIRETVQKAYDEWLVEAEASGLDYDPTFNLDEYMEKLGNGGYGDHQYSTDFYFSDANLAKVFAKDLEEYDGSTLQYVAIMPKEQTLADFAKGLTAEAANTLIAGLKNVSDYNNFKDGVITKIDGTMPLFKFDYSINLTDDLKNLGITDIFDYDEADLSGISTAPGVYIKDTVHKADIDFSNDGIKAAATTAILGGMGSARPYSFFYNWDVPVEEIDLTFDKPFLFLIRDKNTGEVWFTGTVYNPANN